MKWIIWDWNGTLFDDAMVAVNALNDILARLGRPALTLEDYQKQMETPVIGFYQKIFDLHQEPFEALSAEFIENYRRREDEAGLAPGARQCLTHFGQLGYGQAVVSSFEHARLLGYIRRFGLQGYFRQVSGSGDIYGGGKLERARLLLHDVGACAKDTLLIGDTLHDAEVAQALGASCVLIAAGHQRKEDLARSGVLVLESLPHLIADGTPWEV